MTNRIEDLFPKADLDSAAEHDPAPLSAQGSLHSAMSAVATGYAAAHGHPLEHDGFVSAHRVRRRWALGMRAGLILIVLIGIVAGVIAVKSTTGSKPVPLAPELPGQDYLDAGDLEPSARQPQPQANPEDAPQTLATTDGTAPMQSDASTHVVVHVAGQVAAPGVVTLVQGTRVSDAVTAAGGLTDQANPGAINLARVIQDGEQIYVPALGEEPPAQTGGGPATPQSLTGDGAEPQGDPVVNINTATQTQLETLPGIGPALAGRIIAWREAHGGFAAPSDLMSVTGIGPAVMGNVQDLITVD